MIDVLYIAGITEIRKRKPLGGKKSKGRMGSPSSENA